MEQIEILLAKYQSGKLTAVEQQALEQLIADGKVELSQLENFTAIDQYMDLADELTPSAGMDARFNTMLRDQQPKEKSQWNLASWLRSPWRIALPVVMLLFAFWMGRGWTEPTVALPAVQNDMASTLLTTDDVSEKIHLVSTTKIEDDLDNKIIDVLLFTLNNDKSANVRLACIDVLMNYSRLPTVREGLVNAISNQTSPIVLSNLAEAIAASGKNLEKGEFQSRINKDLPPPIKKSMEEILIHL